jgi:hypothetical protein
VPYLLLYLDMLSLLMPILLLIVFFFVQHSTFGNCATPAGLVTGGASTTAGSPADLTLDQIVALARSHVAVDDDWPPAEPGEAGCDLLKQCHLPG